MEVTHVEDTITHAVIGGAKAIDFGISNSAEFFNILSSTLYSDQKLAVIRETLCNAWDAHIEAGITDKPVVVTIDEAQLIIRDFGTGIPQAKIGAVYGTYGGSTKKANGEVTGGFGLGCKAPFAYTDHFEVTSYCEGIKTIYNLSKSNAEVGGKPSIMPIISVPTKETGLQVKINLKEYRDEREFSKLISRIASNGEMLLTLNGKQISVIPFSEAKQSFIITQQQILENNERIMLRYGNVIYPVEAHNEYRTEYDKITNLLNRLMNQTGWGNNKYNIIFQAEPNTISVTPSRESLSMQEFTVQTIKGLLKNFNVYSEKELETHCVQNLDEAIDNVWLSGSPADLISIDRVMPVSTEKRKNIDNISYIKEIKEFSWRYQTISYPEFIGFRKYDLIKRVDSLIKSNFGNKGLNQTYLAELKKSQISNERRTSSLKDGSSSWFKKRVILPIMKDMEGIEHLKMNRLVVCTKGTSSRYDTNGGYAFTEAMKFPATWIENQFPFVRNIVILSYNQFSVSERAPSFPILKHWLGSIDNTLVYLAARSPQKVQAARDFFEKRGMFVIDLTKVQKWERQEVIEPREKLYEAKPRKEGLPIVSSFANSNGWIDTGLYQKDDVTRILKPEYVFKFSMKNAQDNLEIMDKEHSRLFVKLFGDKGGIVTNSNQEKKYIDYGLLRWDDYVLKTIYETISTSPTIKESLAFDYARHPDVWDGWNEDNNKMTLFRTIFADKDLTEYFGLKNTMTSLEKDYLKLFRHMEKRYLRGLLDYNEKIKQELAKYKPAREITHILSMKRSSKLFDTVDIRQILKVLSLDDASITKKQKERVRDFLLFAIEGK